MSRGVRVALAAAYLGYLVCVAYLVWAPAPDEPGGAVQWLTEVLPVSGRTAEFALNVVMFIPLSLLGGLIFRRPTLMLWAVIGLLASILIEGVQLLALPTRSATVSDLVANTAGALVGATVLAAWRHARGPSSTAA